MINMDEQTIISIVMVLVGIGGFCLGAMLQLKKVLFWRIEWIKLEHELARTQGREPRDINEVFKKEPKGDSPGDE